MGFLPAMLMAVSDGLISIKRISAFFKLPEVDRSIIHQDEKYEKAIQITGGHNFTYGLDEDHKVAPELDSSFFLKMDRIKEVKQMYKKLLKVFPTATLDKVYHKTGLVIASQDVSNVDTMVQHEDFDLQNRKCSELCAKYNLPAITFFMKLTNYMDTYFKAVKGDNAEDVKNKQYLHMCVLVYLQQEWAKQDRKVTVEPVIKNFNLEVDRKSVV